MFSMGQTMNDDQLLRYSRQIMLPAFDIAGQEKLLAAHALIVGAGGLGCPVAIYLAAAGVGTITVIDDDTVKISNLQRQIGHTTRNLGENKALSLTETIHQINPDIHVNAITHRLDGAELTTEVSDADILIECTDNFASRTLLNQLSVRYRIPLISGSAIGFNGQVSVFNYTPDAPCYNCLYSDLSDQQLSCSEAGVIAPITGIIGTMQAMEALKVITGIGEPLNGRLFIIDGLSMETRILHLSKDPDCPTCAV